jgi:hypothetical protein
MADQATLNIYQGDDYTADVTVMEADGTTPADLTGYTAQSEIRPVVGDTAPAAAAQFTTTISGNIITIKLTHDDTKNLNKPSYVWDLQIIDATGWITTILAGPVKVTLEVTKLYAGSLQTARAGK